MTGKIVKRDGRVAVFDINKISNAIFLAAKRVGGSDIETAKALAKQVDDILNVRNFDSPPAVEEIQDIVEKVLIENGHAKTAKEYILYRAKRSREREMNSKLMRIYNDLTFKLAKDNDVKRENANIDGDTAMGTMLKYGSEGAKHFYELHVLAPEHAKAHREGDIHIHDLDFLTLTTTCCQIDLNKLFKGGFSTGHGFLREPNDILSYSALACIAVQANQNDQHGGQSLPNFDFAMSAGVRKTFKKLYRKNLKKFLKLSNFYKKINKEISQQELSDFLDNTFETLEQKDDLVPSLDKESKYYAAELEFLEKVICKGTALEIQNFAFSETKDETNRATYQAMEAFIHNLNTMHSRAGAQVPFSNVNYGTDTSLEGRMVVENILRATIAGLGNGETPIFPVQIFKVKDGINYKVGDPNYDLFKLACECSSKRLFPNFSFLDAPYNLQYYKEGHPETEVCYMGCRTRVMGNVYDRSREITFGRGNLSFTTINLPRLGILSKGNIGKFYEMLDEKIELVIQQLLARFEIQGRKRVRNFPFLMGQGVWIDSEKLGIDDEVREVLKHGTLSVGFIGLAECLKALTGFHHGENENSRKLGLEIITHMREKTDEATQKYQLNFTLLATPAEGLSGRFVKLDRDKFGKIDGITDRDYYTNSFHVPVYYNVSAWDKIHIEAPYHELTNAGHITYIEVDGDPSKNLEAFESFIRCMKEAGIGYGSINHPLDRDPVCGFNGIIGDVCPKCGRKDDGDSPKFERIRRITGYLVGTLERFNNAKSAEERDRVKHFKMK